MDDADVKPARPPREIAGVPITPHPSVWGGFLFMGTALFGVSSVLYWSYAARHWSESAQNTYWAIVAAVVFLLVGLTIHLMRRAPKTRL